MIKKKKKILKNPSVKILEPKKVVENDPEYLKQLEKEKEEKLEKLKNGGIEVFFFNNLFSLL